MTFPRLKQPLFHAKYYMKAETYSVTVCDFIRAYDCIWSLLKQPQDIGGVDIKKNALANLEMLGNRIEESIGADVFETDSKQLSFPEDILNR